MYGKNNYLGVAALAVAGGAAIYFWRKSMMVAAAPAAPVASAASAETGATNAAGGIADLFRDVASDLFGLAPQTTVPPAV